MSNQKIYICASAHFPHGDAGANRIQYIAQALMQASYEVVVLSCGQTPKNAKSENGYYYHAGLPYRNLELADARKAFKRLSDRFPFEKMRRKKRGNCIHVWFKQFIYCTHIKIL